MDRARLVLEGLSLGDAFGECLFSSAMQQRLAYRELPDPPWFYTDDTMMAWSVADVLASHGAIDQDRLARLFADRFRQQPNRSYGAGAIRLLLRIGEGDDWREVSRDSFGGQGSYGNGAAMRVAPIGAYFADDLERVVDEARASAVVTHAHPEGVAGAIAVAVAAAIAFEKRVAESLGRDMLQGTLELTPDGAVRNGIAKALSISLGTPVETAATALGNGAQISAMDTVPFALWSAAAHIDDFEEALWCTADGLGDVDTTCAIVGGIVAMVVGREGLPTSWLHRREPLEE
jgi:ADP-ribosylglycohydrolase